MGLLSIQMWEPMRQNWMAEHRFYIEQACKRLLTQFENIEAEANAAAEKHLEDIAPLFNPDSHDESDFYESAQDKGIEFYQLLSEMQERTRLSVIAGMYYEWDKNLREWLSRELRSCHFGMNVVKSIWKIEISQLFDLLLVFGFDARSLPNYHLLDAMRLVVNVFKHGDGPSLDELHNKYPVFIPSPLGGAVSWSQYIDHSYLKVSDHHLDQFSDSIIEFWLAIPEQMGNRKDELEVPSWFEKAYKKDVAEK